MDIRLVEIWSLAQEVHILDFWVQLLAFCEMQRRGMDGISMCGSHCEELMSSFDGVDRWVGGFSGESKHTFGLCKGYIHPRMPNWDEMDCKRKSS